MLKTAMDAVTELREYTNLRSNEKWDEIWEHVLSKSKELDLEMPQQARAKRVPIKLQHTTKNTTSHQFPDVKTKHKVDYFQLLDLLVAEINSRFDQPGMRKLLVIERVLTGTPEPNDLNTILNSYQVFLQSRSSSVRQLESLKDLCDGRQSNLSEVFCKYLLQVFGIHCQTICLPFQLFLFLEELSNITYSSSLTLTVVQNLARSNQLNVSHFVIQRQLLLLRHPETPCRPSKGVPSERLRLAEVINFP